MQDHDALSVSMFWAGALMAFAPLAFAGTVLAIWWRGRRRDARHTAERQAERLAERLAEPQSASASAQPLGSTTRPR